jgi:hypothetical protein
VRGKLIALTLFLAWLAPAAGPSLAFADGGALRLSERRDGRLIAVFTTPTPLRAGIVDVSILVQDADSGSPLPEVPILVYAHPRHRAEAGISALATTEAATNKLFRAAQLEISEPGCWNVEIVVGSGQELPLAFDVEIAEPLPPWLHLSLWIAWPLAAVALFATHQVLARSRRSDTYPNEPPLTRRI